MGLLDKLKNFINSIFNKQQQQPPEIKELTKTAEVKEVVKNNQPVAFGAGFQPVTREERLQMLLKRQKELEQEQKEIAEKLQKHKEVKEEQEEEKQNIEEFNFTPSENQLKERIYKYIYDVNQLRLSDFKRVVMSPTSADAKKYGLGVKGFGTQKNDLLERIYNYKKMGGE